LPVRNRLLGSGAYAPLFGALKTSAGSLLGGDAQGPWEDDPAAAIADAIRAAARIEPTVVLLEDLHLADSATIELMPVVAETVTTEQVLVLGVYRSDGLPRAHPIRSLRAELRRTGRLLDIALRPLTEDQTGRLLAALLGADPSRQLITSVHDRTEGLPFFVEELAAALVEEGGLDWNPGSVSLAAQAALPLPESLLDAVLTRTRSLREQHGTAVEYAATLGVQVDLSALAALAGPPEVDLLIDAGLLVEFDAETAAFRHALVRDALYRSIPWARRRNHHQQVAELLTSRGAVPAVVAGHWIAAHAPEKARPLLLAAAEQHCTAHSYRDAAALVGRALALWPEGEDPPGRLTALERLADCAELSGDPLLAADTWADLALRHRMAGNLQPAGAAHRRAANAAELLGDLPRTAAERARATEAFTSGGALGAAAVERLALAEQLKAAGRLTEALDHAVAATETATLAQRRDVQAHALGCQGALRSALGETQRGVSLAKAGLELALSEQLSEAAGTTYYELGEAFEYAPDYAAAVNAYESAFELCRAHGLTEFAQTCFVCMSPAVRLMGNWDRTLAICTQVLADEDSSLLTRRVAEEEFGLIKALRGERSRARGPLRRAAEFGQANGIFGLEVGATWGLAVVAELDEDEAATRHTVAAMLERCRATQECHYALPALRWAGSFLAEHDDAAGVSTCHRVLATLATRNSSAKVLSALAHVGAELATVEKDHAQASAQFARSIELLSGITAPYEQAHTQQRWGQASLLIGERAGAIAHLTSAYRTARRLGAKPLARRCATALAETGEPVDRRLGRTAVRALDPVGLTRREREVLRHVADGRTNREIAAELFLSTRTVDMHVRNLFTKLDSSSRTGAVRQASQRGLLPDD